MSDQKNPLLGAVKAGKREQRASDDLHRTASTGNPRRKVPKTKPQARLNLLLDQELIDQLKAKAAKDRRYVTDLVREALVRHFGFKD